MSCALALAASLAMADMYGAAPAVRAAQMQTEAVSKLSTEPMYADIVTRARTLQEVIARYRSPGMKASTGPISLPDFASFKAETLRLSALDMQGHFDLAKRGTDGDLKCILKGISEDLPKRVAEVETARTGAQQDQALDDLAYLLNDNVEVVTAPPKPPV